MSSEYVQNCPLYALDDIVESTLFRIERTSSFCEGNFVYSRHTQPGLFYKSVLVVLPHVAAYQPMSLKYWSGVAVEKMYPFKRVTLWQFSDDPSIAYIARTILKLSMDGMTPIRVTCRAQYLNPATASFECATRDWRRVLDDDYPCVVFNALYFSRYTYKDFYTYERGAADDIVYIVYFVCLSVAVCERETDS